MNFEPTNNELKKQFGTKRKIIELFKTQPLESECDLTDMLFKLQKILEDFETALGGRVQPQVSGQNAEIKLLKEQMIIIKHIYGSDGWAQCRICRHFHYMHGDICDKCLEEEKLKKIAEPWQGMIYH